MNLASLCSREVGALPSDRDLALDVPGREDARGRTGRGVDTLAEASKVPLGPRGRTVLLGRES